MTATFSPALDTTRLSRLRRVIGTALRGHVVPAATNANRVLIVDDDPQILSLLERVTRRMGFEPVTADSIDDIDPHALRGLALLLIDLHIGGDHALTLIDRLALAGSGVPVVLMSGYGLSVLDAVRQACDEQNCTIAGILPKPFEMAALEAILAQFRRRGAAEQFEGLSEAIATGQIVPYYQPIVDMRTGKLYGAEALVRWRHPEQGVLLPQDVIPEAEARGLMPTLTFHILDAALRDWPALSGGIGTFNLAVNVTPEVITRSDFVPRINDLLAEHRVAPRRLTLELTESLSALDIPQICNALYRLRSAGIGVALDDFGTGYSSLVALRDLPFNKIKLDRSFVTHAEQRPEERMIMASMTRLARDFGLESMAEGIETQGCFDLARDYGMDYGQGHLIAEPLPGAEFRSRTLLLR